ncbi:plasma membrane Ca2 ATPase, partial [Trypanosoma grayi]|uniref:plasma membrane Ca2 ATPase n=1 Tax=Trypanosoma grayi TaxID=71804 RepID=UPI0004F48931
MNWWGDLMGGREDVRVSAHGCLCGDRIFPFPSHFFCLSLHSAHSELLARGKKDSVSQSIISRYGNTPVATFLRPGLMLPGHSHASYGACDDIEETEQLRRSSLMQSVRLSLAARVSIPTDGGIGENIQIELENIFARANEAMPLYEKLGGVKGVAEKLGTDLSNG